MQELHLFGSTITFIRLKNSAFSPLSDHVYTINRKRTKNPALDNFLGGVLGLFEDYAETFILEDELIFTSQDCLIEAWDATDPFFILLLVKSASGHVDDAMVDELRQVLLEFTSSILEFGADIFSAPSTILTAEQRTFVREADGTDGEIEGGGEQNSRYWEKGLSGLEEPVSSLFPFH